MKPSRSLLVSALALATASVYNPAAAQTAVTLFGILEVGYTRNSGSIASAQGIANSNGGTLSRLGFRGTEDLGSGLKAGFWLEAGLANDSGAGNINPSVDNINGSTAVGTLQFGRRATVSLQGNFGEIRLGRDLNPTYINDVALDPFTAATVAANLNVVNTFNTVGAANTLRTSNGIHYLTPASLGGFFAHINHSVGENPSNAAFGSDNDGSYTGIRLGYIKGPLTLAAATGKFTITALTPAASAGQSNDRTQSNIGGSYEFGVAKLFVNFSRSTQDNALITSSTGTVLGPGRADLISKGYLLGVSVPVGAAGLVRANYSTVENSGQNGFESKKLGLGYEYRLSKRTALYAIAARITNSNGASLTTAPIALPAGSQALYGVGAGTNAPNASSSGYDLGVRHTF